MKSPFTRGRPRVWDEQDGLGSLPKEWGLYRFRNEGKVDYVGITSNLYNRISKHRSDTIYYNPEIHKVEYQVAQTGTTWNQLCEWERKKIRQHSPELIKYQGGNGRRPSIEINGTIIEVRENESIEDALVREGFFYQIYCFMRNLLKLS